MPKEYEVIWSANALINLQDIYYFIAKDSVIAAYDVTQGIREFAQILTTHPLIGQAELFLKKYKKRNRYLVYGNYKIIYNIKDEDKIILINAVFDTRRNPESA